MFTEELSASPKITGMSLFLKLKICLDKNSQKSSEKYRFGGLR